MIATAPPAVTVATLLPARGARLGSTAPSALPVIIEPASDAPPADSPKTTSIALNASLSGARLIEVPAEVIPGRYTRPRYALGFRSQAMKTWVQSMGLDADSCLAPLVRGRLSLSPNGDASGRLMLYARCSFR